MAEPLKELLESIRPGFLALAFAGALVAESFWPAKSKLKAIANVAVGTIVSAVSTPAILILAKWAWPELPDLKPMEGAAYFWFGLLGMQLVPIISGYLNKLRIKQSE